MSRASLRGRKGTLFRRRLFWIIVLALVLIVSGGGYYYSVRWLALNLLVLLAGWMVIFIGITRLVDRVA